MAGIPKKPLILKGRVAFLKPAITQLLATRQLLRGSDLGHFYGMPSRRYQSEAYFEPQVELYFVHQEAADVANNADEKDGNAEINIRLLGKKETTITLNEVVMLATKVKTKFMEPPFLWQKGKIMCTYTDRKKSYKLQILCRSEAEGKRVVEQVLDLQNHSPDWENCTFTRNDQPFIKYPTIPDNQFILGKLEKETKRRPEIDVYFRHALLHLHGLDAPIVLCDRSGKKPNPIVN